MWCSLCSLLLVLLAHPQTALIQGRLSAPDQAALRTPASVTVAMRKDDGSYQQLSTRSTADGNWKIETEPGWKVIEIWARARGYGPGHMVLERTLVAGPNPLLELPMPRGATLRGRVLDKSTRQPVPMARVWADSWEFKEDGDTPAVRSDEHGRFELVGVEERNSYEAGKGNVQFDLHADGADHAALRIDNTRSYAQRPDGIYSFDIDLVPTNCEIIGVINFAEDGEPCPSAMVALIDDLGQYRVTTSNTGGSFQFERIGAGRAMVWAWPIYTQQPGQAPQRLLFATDATTIYPGSNAMVLWLEGCENTRIAGKAEALAGAEALKPQVVLRRGLGRETLTVHFEEQRLELKPDGSFESADLLPGRYQVELVFPEGQSGMVEPQKHDFELERGQRSAALAMRYARPSSFSGKFEAPGADLRFASLEYSPEGSEAWSSQMLEADGSFKTPPLWPAKYRLRVRYQGLPGPEVLIGPRSANEILLRAKP